MHIHIAPVGFTKEPILKVISKVSGIDSLFLLHTSNEESRRTAEEVRETLSCMIPSIELRTIPFSDFIGIVSTIYSIYDETMGKDVEYSVNITAGTNLMAAATCYSSYYIRARIYYSLNSSGPIDQQVLEITAPKAVDVSGYRDLTKEILRYILDCRNSDSPVTNSSIAARFRITKQKVGYHVKILTEDGLVEKCQFTNRNGCVDARKNSLKLTPQGVMIASSLRAH